MKSRRLFRRFVDRRVLARAGGWRPCAPRAWSCSRRKCKLGTPESRQQLIVHEIERGEVGRQHSQGIEWSSSDPKIATVVDGIVTPVHNGRATITAKVGVPIGRRHGRGRRHEHSVRLEFSRACRACAGERGVQLGRVPWCAGRQRGLQALAAGV